MDQVLPKVWVTRTLDAGEVPDGVDHVFVFGDGASTLDGGIDEDTEVSRAVGADVGEYETFATLADDVLYATKSGETVLLVRRDDAILTLAALGKIRNDTARQAVEFLETEHGLESRPFGETLPGHLRRYLYE